MCTVTKVAEAFVLVTVQPVCSHYAMVIGTVDTM